MKHRTRFLLVALLLLSASSHANASNGQIPTDRTDPVVDMYNDGLTRLCAITLSGDFYGTGDGIVWTYRGNVFADAGVVGEAASIVNEVWNNFYVVSKSGDFFRREGSGSFVIRANIFAFTGHSIDTEGPFTALCQTDHEEFMAVTENGHCYSTDNDGAAWYYLGGAAALGSTWSEVKPRY